eukprot:139645_1
MPLFCLKRILSYPKCYAHYAYNSRPVYMHRQRQFHNYHLILVALDWSKDGDPALSLGHSSILSSLKQKCASNDICYNHHISSIELSVNDSINQCDSSVISQNILQKLRNIKNTLSPNTFIDLGIGVYIWNEPHVQTVLSILQSHHNLVDRIILGGPQITYADAIHLPSYYPSAHIYIKGYAEVAMTHVFMHKMIAIPDSVLISQPGIILNPNKYKNLPTMPNNASIASPNLHELPSPFVSGVLNAHNQNGFVRWETQRGCPFACSFCQHPGLIQSNHNKSIQSDSINNRVRNEIEWFMQNNITKINILDPTFNNASFKKHYLNVLRLLCDCGYSGKISIQCRLELMTDELIEHIKQLRYKNGCDVLLEFGIQSMIKQEMQVIERYNNLSRIKKRLQQINELKMCYEISIIYGLPKQTIESFKSSVSIIQSMIDDELCVLKAFPLMILRGTKLDSKQIRERYQIVEDSHLAHEVFDSFEQNKKRQLQNIPHVIQTDSFSVDDWVVMCQIASQL